LSKELTVQDQEKIKKDILQIWQHAGLDKEIDARMLAKELKQDYKGDKKSGLTSGRQLQHPQVGEAFGREGVLGAISNNVKGIKLSDIADKNNVAAKKINAGVMTRIIFSILKNDSKTPLLFPVMWKPILNYFLGKLFGDRSIDPKKYQEGIKSVQINESINMPLYKLNKKIILEAIN